MPNRTRPDPTRKAVLTGLGAVVAAAFVPGCTSKREPSREPAHRNENPTPPTPPSSPANQPLITDVTKVRESNLPLTRVSPDAKGIIELGATQDGTEVALFKVGHLAALLVKAKDGSYQTDQSENPVGFSKSEKSRPGEILNKFFANETTSKDDVPWGFVRRAGDGVNAPFAAGFHVDRGLRGVLKGITPPDGIPYEVSPNFYYFTEAKLPWSPSVANPDLSPSSSGASIVD